MKKAAPSAARPFSRTPPEEPKWKREIDSYDRRVRRWNKKFKDHVVRIDQGTVRIISADRKLPLSILNDLEAVREYDDDIRSEDD
ncbi:hypothetical protein KAU08_03700 [bacterium]|nr:hypothetical protein [bacterium]